MGETDCDSEVNTTDGIGVVLVVIDIVGELVTLGHAEELEPKVLEPDKMIDTLLVGVAIPVIERGVTSVVCVGVAASGVGDGVNVGEPLSVDEGTVLDVILALPPKEIVDGGVSDGEDIGLCVGSGVGVIVNVSELVIVAEILAVGESKLVSALEGVAERVDSALGVSLALAPIEIVDGGVEKDEGDCEGVGEVVVSGVIDGDCEEVKDDVCEDVEVGESLDDCVCEGVNVSTPVPDPVKVGVIELLDVIDALAPRVTLVVGVAVFEEVTDALAEAVSLAAREKLACAVESVVILESILIGGAAETLVLIVDVIESDDLAELLVLLLIVAPIIDPLIL